MTTSNKKSDIVEPKQTGVDEPNIQAQFCVKGKKDFGPPKIFSNVEVLAALSNSMAKASDVESGISAPLYILCSKDKTHQLRSEGNQIFRTIVLRFREAYSTAASKFYKMQITQDIVHTLRTEHNAYFIKPIKNGVFWQELTSLEARDKTSHALRFAYLKRGNVATDEQDGTIQVRRDIPGKPSSISSKYFIKETSESATKFSGDTALSQKRTLTSETTSLAKKMRVTSGAKSKFFCDVSLSQMDCNLQDEIKAGANNDLFAKSLNNESTYDLSTQRKESHSKLSNRVATFLSNAPTKAYLPNITEKSIESCDPHFGMIKMASFSPWNADSLGTRSSTHLIEDHSFKVPTNTLSNQVGIRSPAPKRDFYEAGVVDVNLEHEDLSVESSLLALASSGGRKMNQSKFANCCQDANSDLEETKWQTMFKELVRFKVIQGHMDVPFTHEFKDLWNWMNLQRLLKSQQQKGKPLTEFDYGHIAQLDSIDFQWVASDDSTKLLNDDEVWGRMFRRLLLYHEVYGHFDVPNNFEDRCLVEWVTNQRMYLLKLKMPCTVLSQVKILKLKSLGLADVSQTSSGGIDNVDIYSEQNPTKFRNQDVNMPASSPYPPTSTFTNVLPLASIRMSLDERSAITLSNQDLLSTDLQEQKPNFFDRLEGNYLMMLLEKRRAQARNTKNNIEIRKDRQPQLRYNDKKISRQGEATLTSTFESNTLEQRREQMQHNLTGEITSARGLPIDKSFFHQPRDHDVDFSNAKFKDHRLQNIHSPHPQYPPQDMYVTLDASAMAQFLQYSNTM